VAKKERANRVVSVYSSIREEGGSELRLLEVNRILLFELPKQTRVSCCAEEWETATEVGSDSLVWPLYHMCNAGNQHNICIRIDVASCFRPVCCLQDPRVEATKLLHTIDSEWTFEISATVPESQALRDVSERISE
jgi:hypothetical protein